MKENQSPGIDGIAPKILKETVEKNCTPLAHVFNMPLQEEIDPIHAVKSEIYSSCGKILKPSLVFLNRASYGRWRNNDVTSQEREVTMMLRPDLRTDAHICGTSASQASLFVHHGRAVNRV